MASRPAPLPPPVSWRVPESPAMVPVLLTKTEIKELPEPADFSRIPAFVNDVPVAPLLFSRDASAWKLKVAPCSLLICVPVAQEIVPGPVSRIVPLLVSVPDRLKPDDPEMVSVPALVRAPAREPALHSLPLPAAEIVPLPLIVPLAKVRFPLIDNALLTVSVPPTCCRCRARPQSSRYP